MREHHDSSKRIYWEIDFSIGILVKKEQIMVASTNKEVEFYASLLKSCGESKNLVEGKNVILKIEKSKYRKNIYLANLAIEMYGKCGCLERAQATFDSLVAPNSYSWNIILTAYAQNGHIYAAKNLFDRMAMRDSVSWTVMLKALAQHGELNQAMILFERMPRKDQVSWNVLLSSLCDPPNVSCASQFFNRMPQKDAVSWNTMITLYARVGDIEQAMKMFDETPCRDSVSWNIIIEVLAHGGMMDEALGMFQRMPNPNVVSWTILITAYAELGNMTKAHQLFTKMAKPNVVTWTVMVLGYSRAGNLGDARRMFDDMPHRNVVVWNVMVTAYASRGRLDDAQSLFRKMPHRNVVSWTAMIAAHARNGDGMEAIRLFKLMDLEGLRPDKAAFLTVLDPIVSADLGVGKLVHSTFATLGLEQDAAVGNALVAMYGKWGSVDDARSAFDSTETPDTLTWNSLIGACAQGGHAVASRQLYRVMILEGIPPNGLTWASVLSTLCRVGLLDEARDYFVSIRQDFYQEPVLEHYQCMVDLLGRSGWLGFAAELVDSMPFVPDYVTCMTLLFACRVHVDMPRGEDVATRAVLLDPGNPTPYVVLSSIYSEEVAATSAAERPMVAR